MKSAPKAARGLDFSQDLLAMGWYHSFEFPDGSVINGYMPLAVQKERYARYPIPDNLSGKRLLDIGAWDGWFSFEAERHGGQVLAIDYVEVPTFQQVHRRLESKVDYRVLDFYELPAAGLGKFDVVLFLGVLYHLRHPLLALEIVCGLATDVAIVESFVIDAETWKEKSPGIPVMEFYETFELGNQYDNWSGLTVACLLAMCRAAGFARVELLFAEGTLSRRRVNDKLAPRRGYVFDVGLRLASDTLGSDTDIAQSWSSLTWLIPQGDKARIKLRGEVGAMSVGNFDALPPDLRFFADGDRSVHGFDYHEIGEVNDRGIIIGGKYLAVASADYEYYFRENWGAAVFADAGDAFSDRFKLNLSVGVGARWRSPLGPVRIDVAFPIESAQPLQQTWRLHVLLGPDL